MAKLIVVCLVYIVAAALTSCSASRPLVTAAVSSEDLTHSTRRAPALVVFTGPNEASENRNVNPAELDRQLTDEGSDEFVDDLGPCMGEEHEELGGGTPCRRMLPDYSSAHSNPDVKH